MLKRTTMRLVLLIICFFNLTNLFGQCSVTFAGNSDHCGMCIGYLTAFPTGQAPFSYSWSNGDTTQTTSGLCAGVYYLTVTDSNSCVASDTVAVSTSGIIATVTVTDATCAGCCDGSAFVTFISGGGPPYTYLWTANGSNNVTVTGLCAGSSWVMVEDGIGCSIFLPLTVNEPPLGVIQNTFSSSISIYPNPANQNATLEFNNSTKQNCTTTLYDLRGQVVRTIKNIISDKVEIERESLASGLYFIQLRTDRQIIATGKLTIE